MVVPSACLYKAIQLNTLQHTINMYSLSKPLVFPFEIILEIGDQCDIPTLNALIQTCRGAGVLQRRLYDLAFPKYTLPSFRYGKRSVRVEGLFDHSVLKCAPRWKSPRIINYLVKRFKDAWLCETCFRLSCRALRMGVYPFLHLMAFVGAFHVVKALVEAGARLDKRTLGSKRTLLHCACLGGQEKIARYLIELGANPLRKDCFGTSIVSCAAARMPSSLLALVFYANRVAGVDPFREDEKGKSPLHHAAKAGKGNAVRFLIQQGADVARTGRNNRLPLDYAIERGSEDAAATLMFAMAYRGEHLSFRMWNGKSPLHFAIHRGWEDLAQGLVESGANVSAVDDREQTPLHEAITSQKRKYSIVRLLILKGADPTAKDNQGVMPFSHTVEDDEYAHLLLCGFPKSWEEDDVRMKLWKAARGQIQQRHFPFLDRLFRADSPLGKLDHHGNTALHYIAKTKIDSLHRAYLEIARILLDAGADIAPKNNYGRTPFFYAVRQRRKLGFPMGRLLLSYQVNRDGQPRVMDDGLFVLL